jgi:NADH:ubiquinone oxidoreductase subunit 6 (subunit J)
MAPTWRFHPTPTFLLVTSLLFFLVLGTHFRLWSKNDANHGEPNPPVSTEVAGIGIDLTGFYGYPFLPI